MGHSGLSLIGISDPFQAPGEEMLYIFSSVASQHS